MESSRTRTTYTRTNYIQYLLAKVAEAEKPLSAIDLEKEERVQKQKKATEDLLADNQQIFSLWNELVCAKELLAWLRGVCGLE